MRHLIKPIQKNNDLAIITGITTIIRTAQRIYKVGQKFKYLDINRKFIRKYVPPGYRRPAEIASDLLITGGVVYQVADILYNAQKIPKSNYKIRQTRNNMEQPSSKRQYGSVRYSKSGRPYCRRRY